LENEALDYEKACKIRNYIAAVEEANKQGQLENDVSEWIAWANKKADWFDPLIARKDECFGVRKHKDPEEDRALKKIRYYW
jgi:hypothetical protein